MCLINSIIWVLRLTLKNATKLYVDIQVQNVDTFLKDIKRVFKWVGASKQLMLYIHINEYNVYM